MNDRLNHKQPPSPVTEWQGGIVQVKVPLPFSLKWVNSYLLPDERGYTLIDPGLHTAEAKEMWDKALAELGCGYDRIHTVVLTHQHPDHYGLAGWFQAKCGAPVWMSRRSYAYTQRLWGPERSFADELGELYAQHGMPSDLVAEVGANLESFVERVSPQPAVSYLEAGASIRMGGLEWRAVDAPGHALGQLCFYAEERKWMICGDQVLPDITPNISFVPGEDDDPLQRFLDSLQELRTFEVEFAFPGHRDPFADYGERIGSLMGHHERRLDGMAEMLKEKPCTGYEMCERLFGARITGNAHNLRFAMSETLAHLIHLERHGRAVRELDGGVSIYRGV